MIVVPDITASHLIALGPRLVGATFVWAGVIKAIAPHTFLGHLSGLGLIPRKLLSPSVTAVAGLEVGWGIALLTGVAPGLVYPATVVTLILLASLSWWGVRSGKATDCGCYGGYVRPSIAASIGLNALFAGMVIAAWMARPAAGVSVEPWPVVAVLVGAIGFAALAEAAQRFARNHGRMMFDTSPLKIGRRWHHAWAGGITSSIQGEVLVAFLGPDCPYCSQWVKVANVIVQSPKLPSVVGVVAAPRQRLDTFIEDHGIRFPMAAVSQSLLGRLTQAVPTAVLVDSGRITRLWVGNLPPEFVRRMRTAFFPEAAPDGIPEHAAPAGGM
ncbi:MAG: MauE/DoxX family redox-associated membrane protein [Gemmatimonadaceae bacterium]